MKAKTTKELETKIENISIANIFPSPTNPRKTFDEKALQELSESIKSHGLLQPILVRPSPDNFDAKGNQNYEIVYGERRFRASKLAGKTTIKAEAKWMDDDTVFEIQIIENLERKDVHPLDEADAFKKMLDSGRYTIADIALKLVKSETFIQQRMKLTSLVPELRQDFMNGHFSFGHAILFARLDEIKQQDFFSGAQDGTDEPEYGTVSDLKYEIERDTKSLSEAFFDINDENLVSGCGSCTACPKHSGYNPVLFADMQSDVCFDEKCFESKHNVFVKNTVAQIISEGQEVLMLLGYGKPDDEIAKLCETHNIPMLKRYDEYTTYQSGNCLPDARKGFVMSGADAGKFEEVYLYNKPNVQKAIIASNPEGSSELLEFGNDIRKIEERQMRFLELDAEKVWSEVRAIDTKKIALMQNDLNKSERTAVLCAISRKIDYQLKGGFTAMFGKFYNLDDVKDLGYVTSEMLNQALRFFFMDVLSEPTGSHKSSLSPMLYHNVISEYFPVQVKEIEDKYTELAKKRIATAEAKIEDLRKKIADIKAEENVAELPVDQIAEVNELKKKAIKRMAQKSKI